MISHYWGVVAILLPFTLNIRSLYPNPTFMHVWALYAFSIISFFIFGFNSRRNWIFIALSLWSFLNIQPNPTNISYEQFFHFNIGLLLAWHLRDQLDKKTILKCIEISCVLSCTWVAFNYFGLNPWLWYFKGKVIYGSKGMINGQLINPTTSALYIAITSFSLFKRWPLLILPAGALALLNSYGAILVFIFAVSFYLIRRFGNFAHIIWLLITFFFMVAVTIFSGVPFFDNSGRWDIWANTLGIFERSYSFSHYVFGRGLGFFNNYYSIFMNLPYKVDHPHNEFLSVLISFGLLGVVLLICLVVLSFRCKDTQLEAGMAGIVISFLYMFPLHVAPTALIVLLVFTLATTNMESSKWHSVQKKSQIT